MFENIIKDSGGNVNCTMHSTTRTIDKVLRTLRGTYILLDFKRVEFNLLKNIEKIGKHKSSKIKIVRYREDESQLTKKERMILNWKNNAPK